jgi:predicted alpha/beta-fold hydrolase
MQPYKPPFGFRNPHLQTLYPTLFRRVKKIDYTRERITTPDNDFLDLDWMRQGSQRLLILSHGLEGDSERAYVKGMVRAALGQNYDTLAWNFRGCSGTPNTLPRFYHSGTDDDLATVIEHTLHHYPYTEIYLTGFSMGGNITILYLGRRGENIDQRIRAAVLFSVPGSLAECSRALAHPKNKIYMRRFLHLLHQKIKTKKKLFPELFDDRNYHQIRNFSDFDNRFTAPLHGFTDAEDYWRHCSAAQFIPGIKRPTLLVNAADDPFFTPACQPTREAAANPLFQLEIPAHGGHVGFIDFNRAGIYWSEQRAMDFFRAKS